MKILFSLLLISSSFLAQAETLISFDETNWNSISIGSDKDNSFEFGKELKIKSDASDSPILHKLESPVLVNSFDVAFVVENEIENQKEVLGNNDFPEDSILKIGLVVVGDNQLGAMGKLFAPKWVKNIFDLAPDGKGLDKVYFHNFVIEKKYVGQNRTSPKSKYMHESIVGSYQNVETTHKITTQKPFEVSGIWISADSDHTKRKTNIIVRSLLLK